MKHIFKHQRGGLAVGAAIGFVLGALGMAILVAESGITILGG